MAGLNRICKMYGSIKVGEEVYLWDYSKNEAIATSKMSKSELAAFKRKNKK